MSPTIIIFAFLIVLSLPTLLLACGGCTDVSLLMTLPWAGFGILFVWLWIITMLIARRLFRKDGASRVTFLVRSSTLVSFALLGSVGYVGLAFFTMGSLLLPSLFIGVIWTIYLIVRIAVDSFRYIQKNATNIQIPLLIHGGFIVLIIAVIACWQTKANSLEHCVGCLGYGHHTQLFSVIMPRIVAEGQNAVKPLICAANKSLGDNDEYTRMNTLLHATFCLACIGGPDVENFLSELIAKHTDLSDYYDLKWYKGACYAYAHCAGPRAVDDLETLFEKMPYTKDRDERAFLLVALMVTGSKRGVAFTLDHMDLLFQRMENCMNGSEAKVFQSAAECLIFETDPKALSKIPVYRDCLMVGAIQLADPHPNNYTSEFFWTEPSENNLHPIEEIKSAWEKDSLSIQKRWNDKLN